MGNTSSEVTPDSFGDALWDPAARVPKDIFLMVLDRVDDLATFSACLRVCKVSFNHCNRRQAWARQLELVADLEYPGRSFWTGYQVVPCFAEHSWQEDRAKVDAGGRSLSTVSWRELFASKKVMRERFDMFSGWGSLLQSHFIEGFFVKGSLQVGTLYDMLYEPPRIVYSGFIVKGKRHGRGVSYYPDGNVSYEGAWEFGQAHGQGQSYWKNGTPQYRGSFVCGVKQGLGVQQWATGTYEGEWRNDQPHGRGTWKWTDGRQFVGSMKEGQRDGFGILFYPRNDEKKEVPMVEYEGEWQQDLLHGATKYYRRDGTLKYEGDYRQGLKHGEGRNFKATGALSYEGHYYAGKKEGQGIKYDPDTGSVVYKGHFKKGLFHGKGKMGDSDRVEDFRHGHRKGNLDDSMTLLDGE